MSQQFKPLVVGGGGARMSGAPNAATKATPEVQEFVDKVYIKILMSCWAWFYLRNSNSKFEHLTKNKGFKRGEH